MSLNSIIQLFTPKDKVFYSLFEEIAINVADMGKLIKSFASESDLEKRNQILVELENLEHKNDELTHRVFIELGKNFITPFDREDIHYLAISLDDICDYIYAASKKMSYYKVNPNEKGIQKMAEIIELGAESIKKAVFELRNMKNVNNITEAILKVKNIENQADDLFYSCIEELFEQENDIKMLIKRREVFQVLEIVTDKFEDATNVIESIVIKYA
jgi:uncharacterized protein Yka (UPF0111/DUF47 family)